MRKSWQNWLEKRFQFIKQKQLAQRDVLVFVYQQGYLYLVLILITFVAGVNYANNLILGFCFLISAVLCISFYLTFKQLHGLKVEVQADELSQVGQQLHLKFYMSKDHAQSRYLTIQVGDVLHQVHIQQTKQQLSIPFYAEKRGQFVYPTILIYSVYPFGLVRAWTYLYHPYQAWIAPQAEYYMAENKHHSDSFEPDLDEFRELRNYQLGDSLQAVSWKQVARGQGLYVKVFEQYEDEKNVHIDYEHMPSQSHEEKLQFMMGLVEQCEQAQISYSLRLPHIELPSGIGETQLHQAKLALAQA